MEGLKYDNRSNKNSPYRIISQSFNLGFYLVAPLIIGVLIGLYLDKIFGKKPSFTLIFILFGTIASFYNLLKIVKEER
ncbi:AtpZ/AtpI family protein [Candidatus Roizmanbacteria bacterium]|nr:AtpZ/AtpI family protein [Candidatus Roizmanbacteria bacterium]